MNNISLPESKRIQWIDLARAAAIFCVILCHAAEGIYDLNVQDMAAVSLVSKLFAFSSMTVGRLGVPLFLMISGYLLLDREYDSEKIRSFYKNTWLKLLIVAEIWFVIFEIFNIIRGKGATFTRIIEDLFFFNSIYVSHLWYLPMILGLYLLLPLISNGLRSIDCKLLWLPLGVLGSYAFIFPFVKVIASTLGTSNLSLQFSLGFSGGVYGLYMLAGYLIKKGSFNQISTRILIVVAAISFVLNVAFQLWAYSNQYTYNVWYDCPFLLVLAVCLFELMSRIKTVPFCKAVHFLSYYSFPVYLLHNMIRIIILPVFEESGWLKPLLVVLLFAVTTVLSYPLSWAVSKIPKVGKYILYLK